MKGLLEIETPICNAECMASILLDIISDHFASNPERVTGHPNKYHLNDQDVSNLMYSIHHLSELIRETKNAFYRAVELQKEAK